MVMSFAARQMVVDKMDKQFQADLNTRRGANALIKRSAQMYSDLVVLQKGYTSYNDIIWDMRDNARRNRLAIEAILNRPDMKKF